MTSTSQKKAGIQSPYAASRSIQSNLSQTSFYVQILVLCLTFIWFLAVVKVFILEDGATNLSAASGAIDPGLFLTTSGGALSSKNGVNLLSTNKAYVSNDPLATSKHSGVGTLNTVGNNVNVPRASEWQMIRNHQIGNQYNFNSGVSLSNTGSRSNRISAVSSTVSNGNKLNSGLSHVLPQAPHGGHSEHQHEQAGDHTDRYIDKNKWKASHMLQWPPVDYQGQMLPDEGYDIMPVTGLKVPRFWYPKSGEDWNKAGSKVNGHETIFLMIASYRDFQCRETITSAFKKSDHPERLYVAAVDQVVPGDIGCLDLAIPCEKDPTQMICIYRDQISVYKMDASMATGPVTARHIGDRMYRGQYYVMQMDAHCLFVRHWDKYIIEQFQQTKNEMAVLSSYLTDIQGSLDANGDSTRHTRPIMCNSFFEGQMPARYLRHGSQPEDVPVIRDMPQLQPFWAAGFSFSRGHFKLRVPYDAYQPMVFQGEEIAIGIRGFTHGYDFYAPRDSVVFHEYAERSLRRKKIHMFWENTGHRGEGQRSLRRATSVIGMATDIGSESWDHSEIDKYGLGKARPLQLFYDILHIDVKQRKALQLCPFVKTGKMHNQFQPLLRPDGLGIDYSSLHHFDITKFLPNGGTDAAKGQRH
jgi:hypothetical protein